MDGEATTRHPGNVAGKSPPGGDPRAPRRGLQLPSGPVLGLVTILLIFAVLLFRQGGPEAVGNFLRLRNWQVIVHEGTLTAVVALGSLLIIISGGIDLSVGSVVALVSVVTMLVYAYLYRQTGSTTLASLAAVPAGVLTGGGCGLLNGLVITGLRVSPFVTTLGMLSVARGAAYLLAKKLAGELDIGFPGGVRPGWADAVTRVHPGAMVFNPGFWSLAALAVGMTVLLRYLVLGRYAYAIGSSESTARLCGVPIARTKIVVYTVAGLLTGWAGALRFASLGGNSTGGGGLELDVIAAVVIGGASLNGGRGTVGGTLIGVLILGLLLNGVRLLGMPQDIRYILIGGVIIISTALSRWRSGKEE